MTTIPIRGNLVRPVEIRFTSSGKAVGNASVAVNRGRDDRKETDYYEVVLWEDLAQNAATLEKGTSVIVVGRLTSRQYETKDGQERTVWEVTADAFGPDLRFQSATVQKSAQRGAQQSYGAPAAHAPDAWSTPAPTGGDSYGDDTAPF